MEPEGAADEGASAVAAVVGRQVRLWRESAGLGAAELADALGYSDALVHGIEAGTRIPKAEFLERADEVLRAGGRIAGMKRDLARVERSSLTRRLIRLEAEAAEIGQYARHNVPGLLETAAHARAVFGMRLPARAPDAIDRLVEARTARRAVFERTPPPMLSFVLEEVVLRRPLGGRAVLREQLEHLLELGESRNVTLQVMPTDIETHAGLDGELRLLGLPDGTTLAHCEEGSPAPVVSAPRLVRPLRLRYGAIRAQARTPRESRTFIEKVLREV
ncbi:helix-turn-helix transcriptional regulator [Streptomyces tremellae]|uniref:helix-turn-helix domain-containing protein n=1 Tax=Streptomyces tremellae TaxID=1124239 RepID=UPI0031EF40B9